VGACILLLPMAHAGYVFTGFGCGRGVYHGRSIGFEYPGYKVLMKNAGVGNCTALCDQYTWCEAVDVRGSVCKLVSRRGDVQFIDSPDPEIFQGQIFAAPSKCACPPTDDKCPEKYSKNCGDGEDAFGNKCAVNKLKTCEWIWPDRDPWKPANLYLAFRNKPHLALRQLYKTCWKKVESYSASTWDTVATESNLCGKASTDESGCRYRHGRGHVIVDLGTTTNAHDCGMRAEMQRLLPYHQAIYPTHSKACGQFMAWWPNTGACVCDKHYSKRGTCHNAEGQPYVCYVPDSQVKVLSVNAGGATIYKRSSKKSINEDQKAFRMTASTTTTTQALFGPFEPGENCQNVITDSARCSAAAYSQHKWTYYNPYSIGGGGKNVVANVKFDPGSREGRVMCFGPDGKSTGWCTNIPQKVTKGVCWLITGKKVGNPYESKGTVYFSNSNPHQVHGWSGQVKHMHLCWLPEAASEVVTYEEFDGRTCNGISPSEEQKFVVPWECQDQCDRDPDCRSFVVNNVKGCGGWGDCDFSNPASRGKWGEFSRCVLDYGNCTESPHRSHVRYVKIQGGRAPYSDSPRRRAHQGVPRRRYVPRRRSPISPRRRAPGSPRRRAPGAPAPTPFAGKVFWTQGGQGQSCDEACGGEDNCIESGAWPASREAFEKIAAKVGKDKCSKIEDSGDWQINPAIYLEHDKVCHWRVNTQEGRCGESYYAATRYCPCKKAPKIPDTTPTTTPSPSSTAPPTTTKAPTAKPKPSRRRRRRSTRRRSGRRRRRKSSGSAGGPGIASTRRRRGRRRRRRRRKSQ